MNSNNRNPIIMISSFKYTGGLLLVLLLGLSACEDFFTTTLKIDPPEHETQMVVHAYFSDTDTTFGVALTKSFGLLETQSDDQFIRNANITLQKESDPMINFDSLGGQQGIGWRTFNYAAYTNDTIGGNKQSFTFTASHPDYPTVTATQVMPDAVPIKNTQYKENAGVDDIGERVDGVEITFDDPAGVDNYYEFALYGFEEIDGNFNVYNFYSFTNDFNVEESFDYDFFLLKDDAFDGKEYKFTLLFDDFFGGGGNENIGYFIVWRCLSKELYQYAKSIKDFRNSEDLGLFTEPVTIFSNIENGLGIFGLRTERFIEVER